VRTTTREHVRAVMAALNYHPSLPARSLAGRRSNLLGLVYENPSANYVFDVQSGAMARCRDANLRLFVFSCNDLGERIVSEVLAMAEQTHVDGLVLTPPLSANHALIAALDERELPFVRVAPDASEHPSPKIEMDDEAAARDMTEHLIARGHRSIAFIAGHPDHSSSDVRMNGFRAALVAHRIAPDSVIVEQGYNTVESGIDAGRRMLDRADRPTAIFASNDDMAAGVLLVAHELGVDVPDQLSVAGFDDTQLAGIVWPPLTTIHQPSYDMAYTATDLLIRLVRRQEVPAVTVLNYDLVIRGSTGPLVQADFTMSR
jgi:LacI family transcriptional regulator